MAPVKPKFFATPALFRAWLVKHHLTAAELLVGFQQEGFGQGEHDLARVGG